MAASPHGRDNRAVADVEHLIISRKWSNESEESQNELLRLIKFLSPMFVVVPKGNEEACNPYLSPQRE